MGSSKKSKDRGKKKKKRERSRSHSKERDRHHRHHHKHKKHKRMREEPSKSRSKSLSLSDLSLSDSDFLMPKTSNYSKQAPPPPSDLPSYTSELVSYPQMRQSSPRHEEPSKNRGGAQEISLSIDDTNRLRAKMGLKPLQIASNVVTEEPSADDTYKAGLEVHRPPENLRDKLEVEKLRSKIAAQREKRRLTEKMKKVKGLGESDGEENASAWVIKSRKAEKERKEAEKRNKMMEELDAQFGVGDMVEEEIRHEKKKMYDSKNLSGLRVQHSSNRFSEGASMILTLKDSNILEGEEDTLVNVDLMDIEQVEKNLKRKLKKKDEKEGEEDPFDQPEEDVLSKYDCEISGDNKQSFRLGTGGEGALSEMTSREKQLQKMSKIRQMHSLDKPEYQLATEYMTENDAATSFKKVKKKRKKKSLKADDLIPDHSEEHLGRRGAKRDASGETIMVQQSSNSKQVSSIRQLIEEDDEDKEKCDELMEVHDESTPGSESEHDDLELQEAITRSRRAKLAVGSRRENSPHKILSQMAGSSKEMDVKPSINAIDLLGHHSTDDDGANMTLNLTDEFCRTLGDIPTYGLSGNRADEEAILIQEDLDNTNPSWEKQAGAWEEVGIDDSKVEIGNDQNIPILEEEPDTGRGVVNALMLARKKGYLDKDQSKKNSNAGLQHLRAINYSIDDKVVEDDRRGGREHRYNGPTMDFREKETYKPDVKLDYVDDEGRKLSAKEAFRYLSHKFHGKGSSKNKLEKRMKKWQEELLMKHMSSSDTPLQTLERQREKQKSMGVAYLVLSGGKQEVLDVKK